MLQSWSLVFDLLALLVNRCVICQMEYKRGDQQINLPCKHIYHSGCGSRWLSINKVSHQNHWAFFLLKLITRNSASIWMYLVIRLAPFVTRRSLPMHQSSQQSSKQKRGCFHCSVCVSLLGSYFLFLCYILLYRKFLLLDLPL